MPLPRLHLPLLGNRARPDPHSRAQLQLLLPGVRIWLDVDNLDDVGKLEESVADAVNFLVFLSAGYFKSYNCRRELYAALASSRPFVPIHEADTAKGGASIEALKAECSSSCVEVAPKGHPSYSGPDELLSRIFEETEPIVWVRVYDFQLESLKEISLRMLRNMPIYALQQTSLAQGVTVPGEIEPHCFTDRVTILVCNNNKGALALAEEVKRAAVEGRKSSEVVGVEGVGPELVVIRMADEVLGRPALIRSRTSVFSAKESTGDPINTGPRSVASLLSSAVNAVERTTGLDLDRDGDVGITGTGLEGYVVLLLYLNAHTFLDDNGTVARLVQVAMDRGIAIAPVHEQDPALGGVPFRTFFQQTPQVLQQPPYTLFDTVAVPLYPSEQHRKVSLRHVLRGMHAAPASRAGIRSTAAHMCARCCLALGRKRGGSRIEPSTTEPPTAELPKLCRLPVPLPPEPAPPEDPPEDAPPEDAPPEDAPQTQPFAVNPTRPLSVRAFSVDYRRRSESIEQRSEAAVIVIQRHARGTSARSHATADVPCHRNAPALPTAPPRHREAPAPTLWPGW